MADAENKGPLGIERKLTAKTITGLDANAIAKVGRETKTALYHIIGSAGDHKVTNTQYGDSIALLGNFEAIDATTGETKYSGVYYPPPHVSGMVVGQMRKAAGPVEFALTIGVKPSDNQFGFEYYAETHVDPRTDESMSTLRKLLPPVTPRAIADKSAKATPTK